jgi:pimeloyl-ACP methyl ester carboxylesterase
MALEALASFELAGLMAAWPALPLTRRGDRSPVLVIPAFGATDSSTRIMRMAVRSRGYWAHGIGPGRIGSSATIEQLRRRLAHVRAQHGQKVSLVGWSLGGIYARELARERPDAVRQVITLASPFRYRAGDRASFTPLLPARVRDRDPFLRLHPEEDRDPVPVRVTSIYSRTDGVVRWHSCVEAAGPLTENIEVRSTHVGMAVNPGVLFAVIDRLAQPEKDWRPFRAPPGTAQLFPRPQTWRPSSDAVVTASR